MTKPAEMTNCKIALLSVTDNTNFEIITSKGNVDVTAEEVKGVLKEIQKEIILGRRLVDEVAKRVTISIDFADNVSNTDINSIFSELFQLPPVVRKITSVLFSEKPGDKTTVLALFDDGNPKILFGFYPDELSFRESEFVGLSETQALNVFIQRDLEYLQKP